MTVWSTPVPPYMQGKTPRPEGDQVFDFAASQTLAPAAEEVLSAEGARVPVRRHSLGAVPTAAHVEQNKDKWLEFAPTSPQRRASFVTEPKAVEGNPFDIYKEPEHNNDRLVPNTFYSAGTSYSVNERPVMIASEPDFSVRSSPQRGPQAPPPTAAPPAPFFNQSAQPTGAGGAADGGRRPDPISQAVFPSGNPFDVPLSPVRYNKPAPKVVVSPESAAQVTTLFSDLDPFRRSPSPRSKAPLEQLKQQHTLDPFAAMPLSQIPAKPPQQQQQQQQAGMMPAQYGWGSAMVPYGQPQPPLNNGFGQQQPQPFGATAGWGQPFSAPPQQQQPQPFAAAGPSTSSTSLGFPSGSGFSPRKAPSVAATSSAANSFAMQPWSPKKPNGGARQQQADDGGFGAFSFDAPASNSPPFKAAGGGSDGFLDPFDPVPKKAAVESSFDVNAAKYFGEDEIKAGAVRYDDDDEEDPAPDPEDDDNSMGEGVGFEVQDDQFRSDDGSAVTGQLYDVVFTAPTQFGMLLERKDEWTRGEVRRRERTVVTLVVEGGEAEAKGVSVGSMIVSIHGIDVVDKTYKETLEMVKDLERPMRIVFERESPKDEVIQGYYFVSKGPFFSTPTTMAKWKRKYVVLGGPIAKKNVLQIYDSKKAYHATVVALFQRRRPTHRVKTYALTYSFKCSDLQERRMEGNSAPLKIFTYMTPTARFKSIRVASESRKNVDVLYDKVKRYCGKGGSR